MGLLIFLKKFGKGIWQVARVIFLLLVIFLAAVGLWAMTMAFFVYKTFYT